jgi:murein DD-endopeptidase MepM/ murein hydrolase activator NlpD
MAGPVRGQAEAFQQLEAVMLRQMLQSSGAFRASDSPGSQLRTDMFVETLADAVAKAGGLGIARMLERQIGGNQAGAGTAEGTSGPSPFAALMRGAATSPGAPFTTGPSAVDDLDDANSTAPLPEDPSAPSIDDYQPGRPPSRAAAPPPVTPAPGTAGASGPGEVTDHVTSGFGFRDHPITGDHRFHTGVDLRAAEGAPIRAAADGVVKSAGPRGGYGNAVELDHGDGTSTLYAHASALLVQPGQRVTRGEPVALVGQSGQATGPHLHFELRRHDHPVDPMAMVLPNPTGRALNTYRERVEDRSGGTPAAVGANGGEP